MTHTTTPFSSLTVITNIPDVTSAKTLPSGILVGDTCGGRTFSDNIAAVLESRSHEGWRDIDIEDTHWTVIRLSH